MCDLLSKKYNVTFARKLCCTICLGLSAISLIFLSQTTTFYAALFYACLACTAQSFSAGCLLVNPSDLHPQASGYLFGIMNTVGAIPGKLLFSRVLILDIARVFVVRFFN